MKKVLIVLFVALLALGAYAQYHSYHYVDSLEFEQIQKKVADLEAHVQQLHQEVNYLREVIAEGHGQQKVKNVVCMYKNAFGHSYVGKGATRLEADNKAQQNCRNDNNLTCKLVSCE